MSITVWASEIKCAYLWSTPVKEVYVGTTKVRPSTPPCLCFTANTAGSTVKLVKNNASITTPSLEISYNANTWQDYTINTTITLSNIWDKVYFRNKSNTPSYFWNTGSYFHYFAMTWSMAASGDITTLICKGWTESITQNFALWRLFYGCSALTVCPKMPATTLSDYCYYEMYYNCSNLQALPNIPSLSIPNYCCYSMFYWCSKIKLSTSSTWEYTNPYRIPKDWTWSLWANWLYQMFQSTWWTFTWTPTINTTYYTSNTIV